VWSRITWQVFWHRKHSMHLRNSCDRFTSTCCIRNSPGLTDGSGVNDGISRALA
jgi:murein endopeptidase